MSEIPADVINMADRLYCGDLYREGDSTPMMIARAILAERERCAKIVSDVAESMSKGWQENPSKEGCGGSIAAANVGYFAEQAIRGGDNG